LFGGFSHPPFHFPTQITPFFIKGPSHYLYSSHHICPHYHLYYMNLNIFGYLIIKGSTPIHLSSQNLILVPFLKSNSKLLSNHMPWWPFPHTCLRSFHHMDSELPLSTLFGFLHKPYLDTKICLHTPFSSTPNLYFHFANEVLLKASMFFVLNPSLFLGLHNISYFIQDTLPPLPSNPTKKFFEYSL